MKSRFLFALLTLVLLAVPGLARDLNVADLGAVGDGVVDNTTVFQKALDEVGKAGGGVVNVPAGHYRINGHLEIPGGVTLQGTFRSWPVPTNTEYKEQVGSVLLAYENRGKPEGEPFIRLGGNSSALIGFTVMYPEFNVTDVPPIPYPPCVMSFGAINVTISDCCLVNPYEGIKLVFAARHIVRNVNGYPIWRGLYVDECYDIGRIENVQWCPEGTIYQPEDPFCKWINLNGVAFEFARTDWQYVFNTFCFGYGVGYKFSESKAGYCNGNFLGIGADCCERAILVENASDVGLLITNGEFVGRWNSKDAACVEIGPKAVAKVSLTNCSFWGPNDRCVWMRAPAGQFTADACNFQSWDVNRNDTPAIDIEAGRAILQGNTFGDGEVNVRVGKKVISAIVMGNQAKNGLVIRNYAGGRTLTVANQGPPVVLTAQQKASYTLLVGSPNDEQFVKRWQGPEPAGEWGNKGTKRWSAPTSQFLLPVVPGKRYTITVDVHVPKYSLQPGAGLYVGKKQVVSFRKAGNQVISGTIPASKTGVVAIDVKCKNWQPKKVMTGTEDDRQLGVSVRSVTLRAAGSRAKPIIANTSQ